MFMVGRGGTVRGVPSAAGTGGGARGTMRIAGEVATEVVTGRGIVGLRVPMKIA